MPDRIDEHRKVEIVARKIGFEGGGRRDGEFRAQLRMVAPQRADERGEAHHRHAFREPHARRSGDGTGIGRFADAINLAQHRARAAEQAETGRRRPDAAARAFEKLDAQRRFEIAQAQRHGRLGEIEMARGRLDRAQIGRPEERFELGQRQTHLIF